MRDVLSSTSDEVGVGSIKIVFVMLQATEKELVRRVIERKGHYMKSDMVRSQLAAIERPGVDDVDILPVDAEQEMSVVVAEVSSGLKGIA